MKNIWIRFACVIQEQTWSRVESARFVPLSSPGHVYFALVALRGCAYVDQCKAKGVATRHVQISHNEEGEVDKTKHDDQQVFAAFDWKLFGIYALMGAQLRACIGSTQEMG